MERRTAEGTAATRLAAAMSAGDESALGELVDQYGGVAFSIAMQILGDAGRAEDCVQEAFVNVWRRRTTFDPARGSVRSWVLTAVRNRAIDFLRASSSREARELDLDVDLRDTAPSPESMAATSIEREAVRAALRHLPPEQRQTLELAYFGGFTQSEIADKMGVPLGTVKGRIRLGLEKLASYLQAGGVLDV